MPEQLNILLSWIGLLMVMSQNDYYFAPQRLFARALHRHALSINYYYYWIFAFKMWMVLGLGIHWNNLHFHWIKQCETNTTKHNSQQIYLQ